MIDTIQKIHLTFLRAQGVVGGVAALLWLSDVPRMISKGFTLGFPVTVSLVTLVISAGFVIPALTPRWLSHPSRSLHGIGIIAVDTLAPLLFAVVVMAGVIVLQIPEPASKTIAVSIAAVSFLAFGLMWWIALALTIMLGKSAAGPGASSLPPAPPPLPPRQKVDLRALRHSRMG